MMFRTLTHLNQQIQTTLNKHPQQNKTHIFDSWASTTFLQPHDQANPRSKPLTNITFHFWILTIFVFNQSCFSFSVQTQPNSKQTKPTQPTPNQSNYCMQTNPQPTFPIL